MNHHKNKRKFNRDKNQRNALLVSLMCNLIIKEKIKTTLAKAKETQPFIEKLITHAKTDTVSKRRFIDAKLSNNEKAVKKLFGKIAVNYIERKGGYTRITKLGQRKSDGAEMAIIEFV